MTMSRVLRSAVCVALFAVPAVASAQTDALPQPLTGVYSDSARLSRIWRLRESMTPAVRPTGLGLVEQPVSDARRPVSVQVRSIVRAPVGVSLECNMPVAIDRVHTGNGPVRTEVMDSAAANLPGNVVTMPTSRSPCVNSFAR